MDGEVLLEKSILFDKKLTQTKREIDDKFPWYPYGSLSNFVHLREMFNKRPLDTFLAGHAKILDIGAADGDVSFFLESLGYSLDIVDYGPTNYNTLRGARLLKDRLHSKVGIYELDLDSQFKTPEERYDLIFFLGILYHLKNPFYMLDSLSRIAKHLILSTRVAQFAPDGTSISKLPVGYLLAPDESNNDATNYWIFSEAGLVRLLDRSGWDILEIGTVGDTKASNPRDQDHDERAFVLLRSKKA